MVEITTLYEPNIGNRLLLICLSVGKVSALMNPQGRNREKTWVPHAIKNVLRSNTTKRTCEEGFAPRTEKDLPQEPLKNLSDSAVLSLHTALMFQHRTPYLDTKIGCDHRAFRKQHEEDVAILIA